MPCYVLRAGDTDKVKIGWADTNVEGRRRDLQTAHWEDLIVLRVIEGEPWTERVMHRRFAHQHVRREWYTFDPEMLTWIPIRNAPAHKAAAIEASTRPLGLLTPASIEEAAASAGVTIPELFRAGGLAPSIFSRWKNGHTAPNMGSYRKIERAVAALAGAAA